MFNFSSEISNFHTIFKFYYDLFSVDVAEYESGWRTLVLPIVPEKILQSLCRNVNYHFQREPMLLSIDQDITVVGDLHGHILDLFRILKKFGVPPQRNYLFLGDIIDRGEFSIESLTLIYIMKAIWPSNVFIIRGNHEFQEMCQNCGFNTEIMELYKSSSIEQPFLTSFSNMPLAAIIYGKILCLHGGIGPELKNIDQINTVLRPLFTFGTEPVQSIVWSDPSAKGNGFRPSSRGSGYFYCQDVFSKFLQENKISMLVRGHECIGSGVQMLFDRQVVTVFSASNYCGVSPNQAGVLSISQSGNRKEATVFPPLRYLVRTRAHFVASDQQSVFCINPAVLEKVMKPLPKLENSRSSIIFDTISHQKAKVSPEKMSHRLKGLHSVSAVDFRKDVEQESPPQARSRPKSKINKKTYRCSAPIRNEEVQAANQSPERKPKSMLRHLDARRLPYG